VDACTVTALGAITAFAVPNPGGHLATPSVFSGLAVRRVSSPEPITQLTSGRLRYVASPFLPSTGTILIQQLQLSTPKVGANAHYFHVGIISFKSQEINSFLLSSKGYPQSIHMFFTESQIERCILGRTTNAA
jgi:hypothetical protein